MVIAELLKYIREMLDENAEFEARQIVMYVTKMSHIDLIINSKSAVSEYIVENAREIALRRKSKEPLQYILGTAEFMSLEFEVTPDTLIPRSDTETLVEAVLNEIGERRVTLLDIGSGTGCVGISIAHYANADVTFLDISKNALKAAKRNADRHGISAEFINMDILKEFPDKEFDVIVSNPPYIETDVIKTLQTEVRDYEPVLALDGGKDGLTFYRRITQIAPQILKSNGFLAFETGYNQGEAVSAIMREKFKDVKIIKDLSGNDRVVAGHLINMYFGMTKSTKDH